jgi:hypothetical protein
MLQKTTNSIDLANTHLCTTVAPLVAVSFFCLRPYFWNTRIRNFEFRVFHEKNKGALWEILAVLRAQRLVRRRVPILATIFDGLCNP